MKLISRISPPQFGHASGNASPTRASSFAQAIREVSWEHAFSAVLSVLAVASRCSLTFPIAMAVTAGRNGWFGANTL